MKRKVSKVGLGVLLAGTLLNFTSKKVNVTKSNNISSIENTLSVNETFIIKNSKSVSLPIETIDQVYKFKPNQTGGSFRCLTTYSAAATDVGPYNELYFLFDNAYELPHRTAIFKVGNLASIISFKKTSNSKYEVRGIMFQYNEFFTDEEVLITIDASNVISQETKYDTDDSMYEGDMPSVIVITVESI